MKTGSIVQSALQEKKNIITYFFTKIWVGLAVVNVKIIKRLNKLIKIGISSSLSKLC